LARDLVGTPVAAKSSGCNEETLRRLYREGAVPAYLVGRHLKWDLDELREHFRSASRAARPAHVVEPDFDAIGGE
jgi:hypothetical protein